MIVKFYIKAEGMGEFKELNYYLNKAEQIEYCQIHGIKLNEQIAVDELVSAKKKFWKGGWFSFNDIEFLSNLCLNKKQGLTNAISKRFSHIIIDECQDLSASQLQLFKHLIEEGCSVHFIGDLNQAIWSFRNVNPEYFKDFIKTSNVTKLKLSDNFRCNQSIVNVCTNIIQDNIKGRNTIYSPSCIYLEYNNETELQTIPAKFEEIINRVNTLNNNLINKSKAAIIGRAWKDLSSINTLNYNSKNMYENLAMAFICWNKSQKSSDDLKNAILNTGLFFSKAFYNNRGKRMDYYCIESIDSISWRKYLSNFLTLYSKEYNPLLSTKNKPHNWSSWASIVRDLIKKVFDELPQNSLAALEDIVKKTITQGKSKELVKDTFIIDNGNNPFRLTTIHDVKGETLDAILFLSSKTKHSGGGHFEQWFEQSPRTEAEKEYKRFGYVACSRPKHIIVLAVPKLKNEQKIKLEGLGFAPFTKQIKALF